MKNFKFKHFAGGADYKKMNISVYNDPADDDIRVLIVENAGDEICRRIITADEYSALRDDWSNDGKLSEDDVRITVAALEWIGAFSEQSGYAGNQNARKDDADKASSYIHARCLPSDKATWVMSANAEGLKLTEWIINTLNNKSMR